MSCGRAPTIIRTRHCSTVAPRVACEAFGGDSSTGTPWEAAPVRGWRMVAKGDGAVDTDRVGLSADRDHPGARGLLPRPADGTSLPHDLGARALSFSLHLLVLLIVALGLGLLAWRLRAQLAASVFVLVVTMGRSGGVLATQRAGWIATIGASPLGRRDRRVDRRSIR